jgi:dienelactone hydrolase
MSAPQHPASVQRYLDRLYAEDRREHACRASTPAEFAAWQRQARPALARLLALPRIAADCSGHQPHVQWKRDSASVRHDGSPVALEDTGEDMGTYVRPVGYIHTEPDVTVRFWLLRPKSAGPFPLAVTPHGHENGNTYVGEWTDAHTRQQVEELDQDVAVQAVERGFLTIAPATRGMQGNPHSYRIADIAQRHNGRDCVCHSWQVAVAGRTMLGERVWDLQCLLDWALELPEVDAGRVLMVGNSGGGMATLHTAACDERISVAVPCCAYSNYVSPMGTLRHCPCNAVPGIISGFGEFWDVAGLVAPRSLLTVNGREDALHPVAEVDAATARLAAIYRAAGAEGRYQHRYGDGGHRFYADLMWPWISRALDV